MSSGQLATCVKSRRQGGDFLQSAVVPMWVVYQFFVSVVLLRILIVMLTITYNKILANLNNMWKYARLYLIIQASILHLYFDTKPIITLILRYFSSSQNKITFLSDCTSHDCIISIS